jgi:signal transduction histidine kinase
MGPREDRAYAVAVLRSALRPWTTTCTWWSLVHLTTGMLVGLVTTTFVLSTAAITLSIAVAVPLAVVALWFLFVVAHGMARFERARYRLYCGVDLAAADPPLQQGSTWRRFVERLTLPGRWWEQLYLVLRLPVSAVLFVAAGALWCGSIALAALPAYVGLLPTGDVVAAPVRWLLALAGLAGFVVVAPWATNALTLADVAFGRRLLAHGARSEMEERVERLETSRVAALDSAEAERRRIERDLHDGAQQRLIAAAMDLGLARERLSSNPDEGRALVDHAHAEVKAALVELRDLVRGIHPVILEDRGLDAALSAVVARAPVPVDLDVHTDPRPSPAVESAAYFIVCEALTNVGRHAGASRAAVTVRADAASLRLTVRDDGRGGADPGRGTGLAGLRERVDALGGAMWLHSPPGGPTELEVELPCAS